MKLTANLSKKKYVYTSTSSSWYNYFDNINYITEGETIYCELVQWCDDCDTGECVILAQYLGAMNDVLFPPNMCSMDGVDLLMRRSKDFPVSVYST